MATYQKPEPQWNPFHREVVESPWSAPETDVEAINAAPFQRCCELFEEVRAERGSQALLLYGPAGCGKTHLLARFRQHVEKYAEADPPSTLVAVRLDCSASRLWRHLRARMFRDLTLAQEGRSAAPLRRLLEHARRRYAEGGWEAALDHAGAGHNLECVLENYYRGKNIRHAAAWLRGEALPGQVLESLGLGTDGEDGDGEGEAKKAVFAAVRLFDPAAFVFCFDQLEALEDPYDQHRGLRSFGVMAGELAELSNALVVSSTIVNYIDEVRQAIPVSFMERVGKHQQAVRPLAFDEGRQLLLARLNTVPELQAMQATDPLWPLEIDQVKRLFESQNGFCTARKLIHEAGVWFARACGSAVETAALSDLLESELAARQEARLREPGHPDDILLHGLQRISDLTGCRCTEPPQPSIVDLRLESAGDVVELVLCNDEDGRSLAARVRKIAELPLADRGRLRLLRDAGRPIGVGAAKTQKRLEELQASGVKLIRPTREALTALDACRTLIADAQSGDLSFQGDAVGPTSVRQWLAEHLPDKVRDLVEEIAGDASESFESGLLELLQERPVVRADEAATTLGLSEERLVVYARDHPDAVGLLAGPPAVLFREVAGSAGVEVAPT